MSMFDIADLRAYFKYGYTAYDSSHIESTEIHNLFHDRQYTKDQLRILQTRGQPAETFNIIKGYTRLLIGYYSTVINEIKVNPVQMADSNIAFLLNDTVHHTLRVSDWQYTLNQIKQEAFLSGLFIVYHDVFDTGNKDKLGRIIYQIREEYVPSREIVLDPLSVRPNYSDARWIHRYRWVHREELVESFGESKVSELVAYSNTTGSPSADESLADLNITRPYNKELNLYLVVHTVIKRKGKWYSIYWSNYTILSEQEVPYEDSVCPYRVVKLQESDITEYYGLFREVKESQKAINQNILLINQMLNTTRVMVDSGAVQDLDKFQQVFHRVNAIIPTLDHSGIRIEKLDGDIQRAYIAIDRALDRINRILGINDSFLGMAAASDSGRKVKLQQNSAIAAQKFVTDALESFLKLVGMDICKLIKQYYTASQSISVTDDITGAKKYQEINQPLQLFKGAVDADGKPIMDVLYEEYIDPATGEVGLDEQGNVILVPINDPDTSLEFAYYDVEITTAAYADEDERAQTLIETVLNGSIGNMVAQADPATYLQIASLSIKVMKTRYSEMMADMIADVASKIGGVPQPPQGTQDPNVLASLAQAGGGGATATQIPPIKY